MTDNTVFTTIAHRAEQVMAFANAVFYAPYYFFAADHTTPQNSSVIDDITPSLSNTYIDVYRNLIYGKKITPTDILPTIRNVSYEAGKTFDMYDDKDTNLGDKDYYTVVNASSFFHVYKCLDNNMDANSTVQPNFADITGSNTYVYQTSDGYRWKYMYSYSSAQALKFGTSSFIPCVTNVFVQSYAIPGSIDIIKVEGTGKGYHNYISGTFAIGDIAVAGDVTMHQITGAKTSNGYYTDCILYLKSGQGAGQYLRIADYVSTNTGNYVITDGSFTTLPTNGTQFEINPRVNVTGSGTQSNTCVARALVNALASNIIFRVEVLNPGRDYIWANAQVMANLSVGVTSNAEVRPIISPPGGHGANSFLELGCRNITVGMTFANSESNTIPSTNQYRRVGIMKNPKFWRAVCNVGSVTGAFLPNEQVVQPTMVLVKQSMTANAGNATIFITNTSSTFDLRQTVSNSSLIVLRSIGNTSTNYQFAAVNTVTNSSTLVLSSNVYFSSPIADLFLVTNSDFAVVNTQASANVVILANATPKFAVNAFMIGINSGASATITSISRAGMTKDYSTFVGLNKYQGSLTFGVFNQNEYVYQNNSQAYLHSFRLDSGVFTLYTSNQIGTFATGDTITGNTSTAIMSVTTKYNPEITYGSGKILHIENLAPIARQATQSEVFKVVLNF